MLGYASQLLQDHGMGMNLRELRVTSDLCATVAVTNIDYGSLVQKLLPLVKDRLEANNDTVGRIMNRVSESNPQLVRRFLPQSVKDKMAALLLNQCQDRIHPFIMQEARERNVRLALQDLSVTLYSLSSDAL